jgi:hypothetical protein
MAGSYDFMLAEDRAQKEAEFDRERQNWVSTRSRGMARFLLLHELFRTAVFVIGWSVWFVVFGNVNIAMALRLAIFLLLVHVVFNLMAWYWNERRYTKTNAL